MRPGGSLFENASDSTMPPFSDQQFNEGIASFIAEFEDDEDQLPDIDVPTTAAIIDTYRTFFTPGQSNFIQEAARIVHSSFTRTGAGYSPTNGASGVLNMLRASPFSTLFSTSNYTIPEADLENALSVTDLVTYIHSVLEAAFIFTEDDADFSVGAYDVLNEPYSGFPESGNSIVLLNSLLRLDNKVFYPTLNAGDTFTGYNFTSNTNVTTPIPSGQTLQELEQSFGNIRTQILLERTATGNTYTNGTLTVTSEFSPSETGLTYQISSFTAFINSLLSPQGLAIAQELEDSTQADFTFVPSATPVDPAESGFSNFTEDDVYVIFKLIQQHYNP